DDENAAVHGVGFAKRGGLPGGYPAVEHEQDRPHGPHPARPVRFEPLPHEVAAPDFTEASQEENQQWFEQVEHGREGKSSLFFLLGVFELAQQGVSPLYDKAQRFALFGCRQVKLGVAVFAHAPRHGHEAVGGPSGRGGRIGGHEHVRLRAVLHHRFFRQRGHGHAVGFDDGPHEGARQQLLVLAVLVGVYAHGALGADGLADEVDMGRALAAQRVVAEGKAHQLALFHLRNVLFKYRQLHVQVLGVHDFKQHIGGGHALADAHVHGLHEAALGRAQRGRAHDGPADGQAGQAQAGGLGVGFHLQGLVLGLGALEVLLGRDLLPVQLALPLVLGAGQLKLAAGFEVVLLELHEIGVADDGQHLAGAHPRALQQVGPVHEAAQRGADRYQVFGRYVEHAVHF
nr:hypothetical protein [Tanacetum cinerariifolium]